MFLKVYKGGIVSLQGASFSRKSKNWSGNKLGLLVLMMDEGSVMERASLLFHCCFEKHIYRTTANVPCPSRLERVDLECVMEAIL